MIFTKTFEPVGDTFIAVHSIQRLLKSASISEHSCAFPSSDSSEFICSNPCKSMQTPATKTHILFAGSGNLLVVAYVYCEKRLSCDAVVWWQMQKFMIKNIISCKKIPSRGLEHWFISWQRHAGSVRSGKLIVWIFLWGLISHTQLLTQKNCTAPCLLSLPAWIFLARFSHASYLIEKTVL